MRYGIAFVGFLAGVLLTGLAGRAMMPGLMLEESASPFGVEETVEKIRERAEAQGWVVSSVLPLDESVRKHGGGELPPIRLVNLCQPHHAHRILQGEGSRIVSVMMPCTIAVYPKADGNTYIGTMNAGLLGGMFGGVVAEVMGGAVAREQREFVTFSNE